MRHNVLKRTLLLTSLIISLALFASCSAQTPQDTTSQTITATAVIATEATSPTATPASSATATQLPEVTATATGLPTFNATELAQYNGQNGNPAYIAVNGNVYDVTDVPQWSNGSHFGRYTAGVDLTDQLKFSPHGASKLDTVPIVGTYVQ